MTDISTLTLDSTLRFPAHSLLSLACQALRLLHAHYTQQYETALTAGDEDSEYENVQNIGDVEITLQDLDPVYFADTRLQSGFTLWSATELARRAEPQARISALLELGRIPKACGVIPDAAKFWRESRAANVDVTEMENEDVQLDLLIFLSEKWERAGLFKLMTAGSHSA